MAYACKERSRFRHYFSGHATAAYLNNLQLLCLPLAKRFLRCHGVRLLFIKSQLHLEHPWLHRGRWNTGDGLTRFPLRARVIRGPAGVIFLNLRWQLFHSQLRSALLSPLFRPVLSGESITPRNPAVLLRKSVNLLSFSSIISRRRFANFCIFFAFASISVAR